VAHLRRNKTISLQPILSTSIIAAKDDHTGLLGRRLTMEAERTTYPAIPITQWWAIRERLKQSVPATITPSFLATILNMREDSARANILRSLVTCGLVDDKGKPTDRANAWRDDALYPKVCKEISTHVYPQELRDAFPGPKVAIDDAARWFANKLKVGTKAARKFAFVFALVTEADIKQRKIAKPSVRAAVPKPPKETPARSRVDRATGSSADGSSSHNAPSLHIDIQVHISPEATPDQIDKIFDAKGKHIFKR